jgi:MFS family permease
VQNNVRKYYAFHLFLNLQLWFPIWIIYLTEQRGLTLAQVTLIDIPFWLCIILLQIPGAALADRFGRKPVLVGSAMAFSVAIVFFGLASNFWLLLGSYMVWGIGFATLWGTESAFLFDSLKAMGREDDYPRIYGRGWAVATAAQVAGTILGAPLASATSLQVPIIASGGITLIAVLIALTFKEPHVKRSDVVPKYGDIIRESAQLVRTMPDVRYALMFFGLVTVGSLGVVFFFQPFLEVHDVATGSFGIWQTPMRLVGIVAALAAHRLMRDLGERRTMLLMPVTIVAGFFLLAAWDSVWAQVAFSAMNFGVILSQPAITSYLNRRVPSEQRATVVSLTNLVRSMVLIPSAPLLGLLADNVSYQAAYLAGGLIVAIVGVPLLIAWLPHLTSERARTIPDAVPVEP